MSKIKPTGSGSSGVVAPQPETTATPNSSDTNSAGGSSTQTAQETKSSQQLATAKKEEFGLTLITKKLNSALDSAKEAIVKEIEIKKIVDSAEGSGLEEEEQRNMLSGQLRKMDYKKFEGEAKFLNEYVLNTPNADRALRTYNELKGMQDDHPDQLQDKHIHLLTKGVAQPRATYTSASGERTAFATAQEGILGQDGAKKAAEALIGMPPADHNVIDSLLDAAGKKDGKTVNESNPEMERVLILKAAGAHHETLTNPSNTDKAWTLAGEPSTKMSEIASYSKDIRGEKGTILAQQSTSIDPYFGNLSLQQRWTQSCGPTTAQGMKAEIDPMYARKLHQNFIYDATNTTDAIALEQKQVLENESGIAVPRGAAGGQPAFLHKILNSEVTKYTGVTYTNTPGLDSPGYRRTLLDNAADKLKAGVDVPIAAEFPGFEHFMYLTDVRGSGLNKSFLLTDPLAGKTEWIAEQDLVSGNTLFPNGNHGKLYAAYH